MSYTLSCLHLFNGNTQYTLWSGLQLWDHSVAACRWSQILNQRSGGWEQYFFNTLVMLEYGSVKFYMIHCFLWKTEGKHGPKHRDFGFRRTEVWPTEMWVESRLPLFQEEKTTHVTMRTSLVINSNICPALKHGQASWSMAKHLS